MRATLSNLKGNEMPTDLTDMSLEELKFERDEAEAVLLEHDDRIGGCSGPCCLVASDRFDTYAAEIARRWRNG